MTLRIKTAEVFLPLLHESRYKGVYGGRGSGKSHNCAENIIDKHVCNQGYNTVCIREIQKTLSKSAKKLIENKLKQLKLGEAQGFKVLTDAIRTPGDGVMIFNGMQDHNADSIKSLEDFDLAWVEEAQTLSSGSLEMLKPTIRKPGSELFFSWNPRRKSDPVDKMFRGEETPTSAICVKANWNDNPWFTKELELERQDCLRMNPEQYGHIWEGEYATVSSGAYFAKEILKARKDGRIGIVPIDPLMRLYAFWDIGGTGAKADACAIWIAQFIGKEIRVIDYYEAIGQPLAAHLNWLRSNGYKDALCVLPHDGKHHDKIESITYEGAIKKAQFDTLVIENQGAGAAMQRIEAVRRLFPAIWMDKAKCEPGLDALGWYHEKRDENRNIGLGPNHDWSSHSADAFGLMAISHEKLMKPKQNQTPFVKPFRPSVRGMGY